MPDDYRSNSCFFVVLVSMGLLKKAGKSLLYFVAVFSLLMLALSFTDLPYYAYHSLGVLEEDSLAPPPEYIVVMGGDGMPAPSTLIRLYYAALSANKFPRSKIILAMPMNGENDHYQLDLMARELMVKGIEKNRIMYAPNGFNTRSQAMEIANMLSAHLNEQLVIITSPEHVFRSKKTFEKVGFTNVGGLPAFEKPGDEITLRDDLENDSPRIKNLSLRYNMWSYLHYEILVIREYLAISYYWLKGWI